MFRRFAYFSFGFLLFTVFSPQAAQSHPGGTSKDGCHYCRSRCDYWGVPWNKRHCHGGLQEEAVKTISQIDQSSLAPVDRIGVTDGHVCHRSSETGEIKNKIQSGYNLREIIDALDELSFGRYQELKQSLLHQAFSGAL